MHVLVIPSSYPTSGNRLTGVFYRDQALALGRHGLRVGVVFPDHRSLGGDNRRQLMTRFLRRQVEDDFGITTYTITYPALPKATRVRSTVWLRQLGKLVERYIKEQGEPDVIHAHAFLWGGIGAVQAGKRYSIPVVVTAHSTAFAEGKLRGWQEAQIAEAVAGADTVLAVGKSLQRALSEYGSDTPIQVVPNMVDTGFFSAIERQDRKDFGWLSVAALTKRKGIDTLLRGFAAAFPDRPEVHLTVVGGRGDGEDDEGEFRALTASLGLGDRVRFLGRMDRQQVRSEMHRADAFVLASRVETFGVVLIEALATGLPVVATSSGGPEDIVSEDLGILVPVDDPAALGRAMNEIYESRTEWRERAPGLRAHATEFYAEDAVVDSIVETYEHVIAASTSGLR